MAGDYSGDPTKDVIAVSCQHDKGYTDSEQRSAGEGAGRASLPGLGHRSQGTIKEAQNVFLSIQH